MKEKMKMKKKDFFIVDNKKVRTACLDLILEAFGRNQENFVATSDVNTTQMAALYPDEIEVILTSRGFKIMKRFEIRNVFGCFFS